MILIYYTQWFLMPLLYARSWAKCFLCITSSHLHKNTDAWELLKL